VKMLDEVAENLYVMPPPPKCSPSRARPMPRLRSKGTSRRFGRMEAPEPVSCLALAVGLRACGPTTSLATAARPTPMF
jgi:hypothetical protein